MHLGDRRRKKCIPIMRAMAQSPAAGNAGEKGKKMSRTIARRNWRNSWKQYTRPNASGSNRPQSNRRVRRQYWREAWTEREPGEYQSK